MSETSAIVDFLDTWHIEATGSAGGKGYCVTCGPDGSNEWPCPVRQAIAALAAAQEEARNMREALEKAQQIAREAYTHWDADRDSKVGKLLAALGGTRGIRPDFDTLTDALARGEGR